MYIVCIVCNVTLSPITSSIFLNNMYIININSETRPKFNFYITSAWRFNIILIILIKNTILEIKLCKFKSCLHN